MRCVFLVFVAATAWGQATESDPRMLHTLISEVQQLRLAIERSTLLNARAQLSLTQLQLQENTVARLTLGVVLKITRQDGHLLLQENQEAPGQLFPEA
jgi:hypothetical protein